VETSGTTRRPKRVALSADALLASAAASQTALGAPGQWILALPTHYIAGLQVLVRSIAAGTAPAVSLDP
jgi:O-succinylbenzoic acid--CoA ligase